MADNFIMASFAFACTANEAELLKSAFDLVADLYDDMGDAAELEPALAASFPPIDQDPFSGLRSIFCDPDYPDLGADIDVGAQEDGTCAVFIYGTTAFQPDPVAILIQRCCPVSLAEAPIAFEWAETCSRPRIDEFGGGYCVIFADDIDIRGTRSLVDEALLRKSPPIQSDS